MYHTTPRPCLTHTQYTQVEMYHFQPLQVEKYDLYWPWITVETLVILGRATAARHMRIPILQKTLDKKKRCITYMYVSSLLLRYLEEKKQGQGWESGLCVFLRTYILPSILWNTFYSDGDGEGRWVLISPTTSRDLPQSNEIIHHGASKHCLLA